MILPKVRDPRFITVRRGGTLSDQDHHLLALWAAACPNTSSTASSRCNPTTLDRVRRSSMPAPGSTETSR